jgi:phosphopantetheinyl transferase (holo-ACP synthase)
MIGNDIVDLDLAKIESNWKRKGFLDKIFTFNEQTLIHNAFNPTVMVWNLWSRKEAAYKIYNRHTGISGYFPWLLHCHYEDNTYGTVAVADFNFYTRTEVTSAYIYTIAVSEIDFFDKIANLKSLENIKKENGIPYVVDSISNKRNPVSITHHGRFQRIITVL